VFGLAFNSTHSLTITRDFSKDGIDGMSFFTIPKQKRANFGVFVEHILT